MLAVLAQMKLLVNLAQVDGHVAEREKNYIVNIGRANGIYPDEILPLFSMKHDLIIPQDLSHDEKFKYIFSLVQLMKIDERMYKEEIMFCSEIAANLGYHRDVMFDLMLHVKTSVMPLKDMEALKKITDKHLRQKG
jgi:hypothetical protein